ncbi:SRPBCC domain-containing protein [Streptomyces sp. NPDC090022]|uniref:SRPBCC domain-containing protein n=1 Tax=Streptomyces sp. NPDC090022 TaxID=3365920 RepID=UPI0038247F8A
MEHLVFVPVAVENLRAVLRDPVRVARCVPGLQQDADEASGPLAGRLKLRVGGHTVTYRGALTVTERDPDTYEISGEGTEVRGSGTVKLALALRLADVDGGTRVAFTGDATADGRAAAFAPEATTTAVHRLLDRTAAHLATVAGRPGAAEEAGAAGTDVVEADLDAGLDEDVDTDAGLEDDVDTGAGPDEDEDGVDDGVDDGVEVVEAPDFIEPADIPPADIPPADGSAADVPPADVPSADVPSADFPSVDGSPADGSASVFDAEVPPPSLDPSLDPALEPFLEAEFGEGPRPPAEAAHARRTMIGRSAEEVDHAPPRGRYAPVPAPATVAPGASLRWLAPAAALAIASAVVVGRVLRRRR